MKGDVDAAIAGSTISGNFGSVRDERHRRADPRPTFDMSTRLRLTVATHAAMREAGNRDVTTGVMPGADHGLFAPSGLRTQWFEQRPVSGWVDEMTAWVQRQSGGR